MQNLKPIKFILEILIILFFVTPLMASVADDLLKLSKMYNDGLLSKKEFEKAKSILLEIETIQLNENNKEIKSKKVKEKVEQKKITHKKTSKEIKIERIFVTESSKFTNKSFEKMKLTVGDFMIFTHRPGAVKIKKISNNKQYVVIGDRLKIKYYNNGKDFFDIKVNKEKKELILKINGVTTLVWKGQYVQKAEATFYQILAMGRLPFHFYIKLDTADNAVALNMEKFNRKIELAVNEVKVDLAKEFGLTVSQIDQVIRENDMLAAYGEIIPVNNSFSEEDQKKFQLYDELKNSIGENNYKILKSETKSELKDKIDISINQEVRVAIDETIRDAINSGVETAALEAGLAALIDALMSGASWADALKAGEQACGCE